MNSMDDRRRQAEIRKLEAEAAEAEAARTRGWITTISLIVGIIVSTLGIYHSMIELAFKNRQLAMEAQVRSHEIFLNQVLDRMSGVKVETYEPNKAGILRLSKQENFGGTTQVGAYAAAVALACEFKNLRKPAEESLRYQTQLGKKDPVASKMLTELQSGCEKTSN